MPSRWRVQRLRSAVEWEQPEIQAHWRTLCQRSGYLDVLYQSPEWFAHLDAAGKEVLALYRGERRVGLVPVCRHPFDLDFVIGSRQLGRIRLPSLRVLGAEPLLPPEPTARDCLLSALTQALPVGGCVNFPLLPRDSAWRPLVEEWATHAGYLLYAAEVPGAGATHALRLESSGALSRQFNSKQRNNIKRRLKLLAQAEGPLRLVRYATVEEVAPYLAAAEPISRASWQFATVGPHFEPEVDWPTKLTDLARRGLLRSYVLFAGNRACAFVLGYDYGGVFYHVKTGYDRSLARLAPGIALLYLLIEEQASRELPCTINFGFGDTDYKREFSNLHVVRDELLLLPQTLRNRLLCRGHAHFRAAIASVRDRVRRYAPLRRAPPLR